MPPRYTQTVDDFLHRMQHPLKPEIEALRLVILGADPRVQEGVKWNAPSFFIDEHFATFKLRPETKVQIVLHTGAKRRTAQGPIEIPDPTGLLTWAAEDRCVATFASMADVVDRQVAFSDIVRQWIDGTIGPA